ncbi:hypothetical protein PGT21_009526 [Puccinia graminis f. sp. tritici]|uniref:Uncharacterized protein n=2 Tax=Puccinia graminis f. sp. tritici TaxID=56615 RepID=E3KER8_PUCGT|nr:uncharacterized protein PGTG_08968 [Puccinia graminis f. sp. tritici CRL 75-36-700-3]EFP82772.1 hypothetical protein PGTG_08968 [Puccinia graminis f. sp. tritici CRL 75-36-700-3]KAA1086712.1 hypothetical protein PGT21_009526 [Puccinia graminis f. sp. tritici]KAA1125098.1 hypothetical protein PGTUg99_005178 [Puccinia graminis f. sp. tritici]
MGHDNSNIRHKRSASTGSLPALGRRLSNGSLRAVKWIGKQFKNKKPASDSDSDESWGTPSELPLGQDAGPSRIDDEYVPQSTLAHRARREALEKHWNDIYSFDWPAGKIPSRPVPADPVDRPLTSMARGRRRLQSLNSSNAPPHPFALGNASIGHLPARVPQSALRMRSLEREEVIATLPKPKPPPVRPLPPPPVSLYPIPPTLPLNIRRDASSRSQTPSESLYSDPSISDKKSRWKRLYDR